MSAMESVKCFCIDFTFAFDLKGNIETFSFSDDRDFPSDFNACIGLGCRHVNVASLVSTSTTNVPIFDFEVGRYDVTNKDVLKCSISVVFKQNKNFISALATHWNGLLSSREITAKVANTNGWCFWSVSQTNWSELLRTELETGRCINALICR